jgi:peptide/nickel transport system substrate-binding protein
MKARYACSLLKSAPLVASLMLGSVGTSALAAELGTITIATQLDLLTLNSSKNVTGWHRWVYRNIYDPLITLDENNEIKPALATSWERIADNTWRFKLREDIKFQNGEPFTAEAVKLWIDEGKKADSQARGSLALITEAKVIDDHTLDMVTDGPVAYFIDTIADRMSALPPAYYKQVGAQEFGLKPVGTGPYKFVSWRRGDRIVLEPNPDYWGGAPKADGVVFWVVPDASARAAAVLNGEATLGTAIAPLEAPRFEGSPTARISASEGGNRPIWGGMMMNRPIFQDRRVREAINLAVNRQAIVDRLLRGYGKPMGQLCATSMYCYDPSIGPMPYDPAKAKSLLQEAGLKDMSITLHAPQGPVAQANELTQIIAANLKQVGFNVSIRIDEASQFSAKLYDFDNKGKDVGDLFIYFYQGGPGSETTIRSLTNSKGNWNWQYYHDAQVDTYWDQAQKSFDQEPRQEVLQKLSAKVRADMPWLFLYEPLSVWAVSNKIAWKARADDQIIIQDMGPAAK